MAEFRHPRKTNRRETNNSLRAFKRTGEGRGGYPGDFYRENTPWVMAEAYWKAADIVVSNRHTISMKGDTAFWPAVFLYRHSIELLLKEILWYGSQLPGNSFTVDSFNKNHTKMKKHDLMPLWRACQQVLRLFGSTNDTTIDEVIGDFHSVDSAGFGFRYYTDKEGDQLLTELPAGASLEHFATKAAECCRLLGGVLTGIHNDLWTLADNYDLGEH